MSDSVVARAGRSIKEAHWSFIATLAAAAFLSSTGVQSQIAFTERAGTAGLTSSGETYGSSWGDLNADGYPDLFTNNHRQWPSLWVNDSSGQFTDVGNTVDAWVAEPFLDQHGAAWVDFNNDGLQDLLETLGAADENQFLINEGGTLVDRSRELDFEYRTWPGRMPLWVDYDRDGRIDIAVMQRGKAIMHRQTSSGGLTDVNNAVGMNCQNSQFGMLADVNFDDRLDIVCTSQAVSPTRIYDMSTIPFTEITATLPPVTSVLDTVAGDFNGDLRTDFFTIRGTLRPSDAAINGSRQVEAHLVTENREETMTFETRGRLTVTLSWSRRNVDNIFIGSDGFNPAAGDPNAPISFELDPSNPATWGVQPHDNATDEGLYIGYDRSTNRWTFSVSTAGTWNYTYWFIDSTATVSNLTLAGLGANEISSLPSLLMATDQGYVDETKIRGIRDKIRCVGATAADFDNDMDEDIYVICRGGVTNDANILFENQGNGTFVPLQNAGGAAGPVGTGFGYADSVSAVDYDADGFIDLFVTNGLNLYPDPPISTGGSNLLFHNSGNNNSWIELELVGTSSNATAVGAKVYATAGGKTQLREQDGGYHRWTQDHQRIHFGLAQNNSVNLTVKWPNGGTETFNNVAANKVYKVIEGSGLEELFPSQEPVPGASVNDVSVSEADGNAVFVVNLSSSSSQPASVNYRTQDGTAVAGRDYQSRNGTLRFAAGETRKTINVPVIDTAEADGTRTFTLRLSNPSNATLSRATATARIADAGAPPPPPPPPPADTCGAPTLSGYETGLFMWQDCTSRQWSVRLFPGRSFSIVGAAGDVSGTAMRNVRLESIEWSDNVSVTNEAIAFSMRTFRLGSDGFDFSAGNDNDLCVDITVAPDNNTVYLGPEKTAVTGPFNPVTGGACGAAAPPQPTGNVDGEPNYNPAGQSGIWVWRAANDEWFLRATGGGSFGQHVGTLSTSQGFSAALPYSVETHDTYQVSGSPARIDFNFRIWGSAEDGIDFRVPANSDVCLDIASTTGNGVFIGSQSQSISTPYNLTGQAPCP